jgi:3'(2'), 5'-bisphosphate nucleotidase
MANLPAIQEVLTEDLLEQVMDLARQAGEKILEVYNRSESFDVETKKDDSPVTEADLAAHAILDPGLVSLLDQVPVLSEESTIPSYDIRSSWSRYWIIDPLDGTKEFIKKNGEFTVNIALVNEGVPVLGVVYVPVLNIFYCGMTGKGAIKVESGKQQQISTRNVSERSENNLPVEVVASRSHGAEKVDQMISSITDKLGPVETKNMGSSLKLCLVAEGQADIYPRLALTSEWDTAAAQAVVEAAGGKVIDIHHNVMRYNTKDDILNPFFFVIGDTGYDWESLLPRE